MIALEFMLAISGLACAVTGEFIVVRDWRRLKRPRMVFGDEAFWGLLGLVLCQVLWIVRLAA